MTGKYFMAAALAASVAGIILPSAASAQDRDYDGWGRGGAYYENDDGWRQRSDYARYDGYDRGYYADDGYAPRYNYRRSHDRRCHRDGTTGAVVGALAGGLIGNGIAGRGDRTLGTLLGAGAGALAGRAIERSGNRC